MTRADLILGIDGGGSKTVAWLASRDDPTESAVLGRGRSGAANMRTTDFASVTAHLHEAIGEAFQRAGIERDCVASACFALAGAGRPEEQARVQQWATGEVATKVTVTNDALPVLDAGTPEGWGIVIVSGTGSFAMARDRSGNLRRCGGWGPTLGDEGSGYAIALAGLRAAIRSFEQRGPTTSLLTRFLDAFELERPSGLISAVYREDARQRIAHHVPLVFTASREGDTVAREIVSRSANQLADLAIALAAQMDFGAEPIPLACSGGVLIHQAEFCQQLTAILRAKGVNCEPTTIVINPVAGTLQLASRA